MSFLLNSRRLASSVSFAALTIVLAFGQQLTQKADAEVVDLYGSGTTSILPLASNWFFFSPDIRITYEANGNGGLRLPLLVVFKPDPTDFVSTDSTPLPWVNINAVNIPVGLPPVEGQVAINAVNIPVAIIYNLPGFTASLSTPDVCGIIAGTITDFSQLSVPGAPQPISFYYRSDSTGTTSILNTDSSSTISILNTDSSSTTSRLNNFTTANCGFSLPPFPVGTGVSGSDGMISAVQGTVGAIGYVDTPAAKLAGAQIAPVDQPISGPNYFVFHGSYPAPKAAAVRALCQYITDDSPTGGRTYALGLGYTAGTSTSDECSAIQDQGQDAPIPDPGS